MSVGGLCVRLLGLICFLISGGVSATSVEEKTLGEVVDLADTVIVATVVNVDMVDTSGAIVDDPEARTGPGLDTSIRLHLDVQEIIYPQGGSVPKRIVVELWQMWHNSLGNEKKWSTGKTSFFLLKGKDFKPAYPAFFQPPLELRDEVLKALELKLRVDSSD